LSFSFETAFAAFDLTIIINKPWPNTHFDIEALQHVSPAVTFLSFGGNVLELCRLSGSKVLFVCIFIGIS